MELAAKMGVDSVVKATRNKPIYARPAALRGTLLTGTVPRKFRPQTPVPKRRVLVIDGCSENADSLVFMLSHVGYVAKAIYSAAEGLETAKQFRPDMLICALSKGMQNIPVATSIRKAVPECKVLLFSPSRIESYAHQRVDDIGGDCELIDVRLHPQELLSKIKVRLG